MKRLPGFALLALIACGLVACASAPPATTAQARCEQQVYDDPAFKALYVQSAARNQDPRFQEQLVLARRKSVNDCLTAQGVTSRGGVEPVAGARYGAGWFNAQ